MSIRPYIGEDKLNIDGRGIPYPLVTAADYLEAKHGMDEDAVDKFIENNYEQYRMLNTILAMKQSCVLLRHTTYSCGSLDDDLFGHKCDMVEKYNEAYNPPFDEQFYENYHNTISSEVKHLSEVNLSEMYAPIAVIFEKPLDFPDKYVVRLFDMDRATNIVVVKDTLDECRNECLNSHFSIRVPRFDVDDSHIVESWVM